VGSSVAQNIGVTIPTAMRYLNNMYIEGLLDFDEVGNKKTRIWKLRKREKEP